MQKTQRAELETARAETPPAKPTFNVIRKTDADYLREIADRLERDAGNQYLYGWKQEETAPWIDCYRCHLEEKGKRVCAPGGDPYEHKANCKVGIDLQEA